MIALLITARMGSSRLARKHLIRVCDKPLLYWLIKRYEHEFQAEIKNGLVALAVATSDAPGNEGFAEATAGTSCQVLHGSDTNIPLRHLQCAQAMQATHVLSVDGDDILCSTLAARVLYEQICTDPSFDLYSVTGLPLGMNLSAYSVAYLRKSLEDHADQKLETGWGRIFVSPRTWTRQLGHFDIMGDLRFTLDYKEDADFFCAVIGQLGERIVSISDNELISFVQKNELYKLNSFLKEEYWKNYHTEKDQETNEQK